MADIKDGTYYGVVSDHGFGPAEGKDGTPFINVEFALETMDEARTPVGTITGYFYLSDKAIEFTAQRLRAIGYAGNNSAELADGTYLRGRRCQVVVENEVYEGKTRPKVKWINPENWTGGVVKSESSAKANTKRLDTLLKTLPVTAKGSSDVPF